MRYRQKMERLQDKKPFRRLRATAPLLPGTFIGALFLVGMSVVQKLFAGYSLHPRGFIVPLLAGGVAGALVAFRLEQVKQMAQTAEGQDAFVVALLENIPTGVVIIDPESHVVMEINTTAAELIGKPAATIIGQRCHDLFCLSRQGNCPITVGGKGFDCRETVLRQADGAQIPIIKTARLTQVKGQSLLLESFLDNSKQKETETALRRQEEFARLILDSTSDHIALVDQDGKIFATNLAWKRFSNNNSPIPSLPSGEGANYFKVCADSGEKAASRALEGMLAVRHGALPQFEYEYACDSPDGKRWFLMRVLPLQGQVGSLLVSHSDISLLKQTESRNTILSATVQHAAESILVTDSLGNVIYVNPGFERIAGYSLQEVLGFHFLGFRDMTTPGGHCSEAWEKVRTGTIWSGETSNRRKDGTRYTGYASISPIWDNDGNIIHFVEVSRDISREKQLETDLLQAQKMEAIGRLAGGVAHDFNNMLTPILAYTELMLRQIGGQQPQANFLQEIRKAAMHSRDFVRQLLAFSRKQNITLEHLDLGSVVSSMEPLLRKTVQENIELDFPASVSFPVLADRGQLEQILLNLTVNAKDAMPGGGRLTIQLDRVRLGANQKKTPLPPDDYCVLKVSDTGHGIPPDIRQHIFEPFFTTKGEAGTGLGLATVYGIVKQLEGEIRVESEPCEGTTFTIYLPLARQSRAEKLRDPSPQGPLAGPAIILLVEDSEIVRCVAEEILSRDGYEVLAAENAEKALELVEHLSLRPDLLVTDVVMPGMNGKELAGTLQERQPDIKVLYMSGYTENIICHHGIMDSGINFIPKPFSAEDMTKKVSELLNGR